MDMRGFNIRCIILAILLCSYSFQVNDAIARVSFGYGVESLPLQVNQQLADHIQKTCNKELAEIEKEHGECDLYLLWKPNSADTESISVLRRRGSHETLVKLSSNLEKPLLACLHKNYNHHLHTFSGEDGRIRHVKLTSNIPKRVLGEKNSDEIESSDGKKASNDKNSDKSESSDGKKASNDKNSDKSESSDAKNASNDKNSNGSESLDGKKASNEKNSSKDDSSPSLGDVLDKPIYIPPEVLFKAPPPPAPTKKSSESTSAKEAHLRKVYLTIFVTATSLAVLVVILGVVLCCFLRGGVGSRHGGPLLTSNFVPAGNPNDGNLYGGNTNFNGPSQKHGGNGLYGTDGTACGGMGQGAGGFGNGNGNGYGTGNGMGDGNGNGNGNGDGNGNGNGEENTEKPKSPSPPPPPPPTPSAPPPPPPKAKAPPPPPLGKGARPPPPPGKGKSSSSDAGDPDAPRTKLKPFFWDKMTAGNSEHSMVWDEIRAGSFQFNEEMIESLFGYNTEDKGQGAGKSRLSEPSQPQFIQMIDPKKSQNLSILLKALNVTTEEVRDALTEGNELPPELLQTLLRMAPTQEEELKLRLFSGELAQLGPAERFLKVIVDIPFAFKRMESLMFMMNYKEEVSHIKDSFRTLEVACDELKKSRLFLKILEAVLKTGNRMNDGTYRGGAQAFKLDTLLKLSDVKGTDGKTTLLHFVLQEIVRTEGLKAARADKGSLSISSTKSDDFVEDTSFVPIEHHQSLGLKVVSSISSELEHVKKAAIIDSDVLTSSVAKLGQSLVKIKNFLSNEVESSKEESGFYEVLVNFSKESESEITLLLEEERRISDMVRKTADYFNGSPGREEGLKLFTIVRDFLILLDRICNEIRVNFAKQAQKANEAPIRPSHQAQEPQLSIQEDMRRRLFPAIADRRVDDDSSSDSDSDSSDDD